MTHTCVCLFLMYMLLINVAMLMIILWDLNLSSMQKINTLKVCKILSKISNYILINSEKKNSL